MDFATILGIISGIALVIGSILMNSGLELFINYPSLMVVAGGTIAALLIAYPLNEVLKVMGLVQKVFRFQISSPHILIKDLVDLATIARKQGILAIDKELKNVNNEFLRKGLQLVVDGVKDSAIDGILQIEVVNVRKRHQAGWEIFAEMGKYAPAFGLIGTLIGLIQMLATLDEPGGIGPKMAVALITTFYGALFANLILVPMSVKLKRRSLQEALLMSLIIEAIKSIRLGENPKFMEEKLMKFLSEEEKGKSAKKLKSKANAKAKPETKK